MEVTGEQMNGDSGVPATQSNQPLPRDPHKWQRSCDECGRAFAYLDVHLSKNKLCQAAYALRDLRQKLGDHSEQQTSASTDVPGISIHASNTDINSIYSNNSNICPRSNSSSAQEDFDSTANMLLHMHHKLLEFDARLDKCESLVRSFDSSSETSTFVDHTRSTSCIANRAGAVNPLSSGHETYFRAVKSSSQARLRTCSLPEEELEILDRKYLLSSLRPVKVATTAPAVHKTHIQKLVCVHCGAQVKYLLSHLSKSFRCQVAYDMTQLRQVAQHSKRLRQKYYLRHLKKKKKQREVFEILEPVRLPRPARQTRKRDVDRPSSPGRHADVPSPNCFMTEEPSFPGSPLDDTISPRPISVYSTETSCQLLTETNLPLLLAETSFSPRKLSLDAGTVTASGPATTKDISSQDYLLDDDLSNSSNNSSSNDMISSPNPSTFLVSASPTGEEGITVSPSTSPSKPSDQNITWHKRPKLSQIIKLSKAGKEETQMGHNQHNQSS